MSKLSGVIGFVLGAGIGGFVAWRLLDIRYEARFNKELESVKAAYARKEEVPTDYAQNAEPSEANASEENLVHYAQVLKETKYANDLVKAQSDYPYAIPEEDVGENYDYGEAVLYYFADGVLTDSNFEPLEKDDIRDTIGENWSKAIGSYGDPDLICFCNDARQCYYRIMIDERNYTDI